MFPLINLMVNVVLLAEVSIREGVECLLDDVASFGGKGGRRSISGALGWGKECKRLWRQGGRRKEKDRRSKKITLAKQKDIIYPAKCVCFPGKKEEDNKKRNPEQICLLLLLRPCPSLQSRNVGCGRGLRDMNGLA